MASRVRRCRMDAGRLLTVVGACAALAILWGSAVE